ncbi:MAG: hypothetical protein ACOX4R_06575 [Lentihominibacter sp.]|jgi:hypothetical protein
MIRYDLFKHLSVGMTSQVIFDLARMFDNPEDLEKYLLEEVEIPKGVLTKKPRQIDVAAKKDDI